MQLKHFRFFQSKEIEFDYLVRVWILAFKFATIFLQWICLFFTKKIIELTFTASLIITVAQTVTQCCQLTKKLVLEALEDRILKPFECRI